MKIILSNSNDPYYNLSLEEILLKDNNINEDIVLIYINQNAIIIGRNQNAHEEINSDYVSENEIKLVRRVSGGGAVYHDKGNINFSFITKKEKNSYSKFLEPIILFLKSLGLNASFKGKNDLVIDGFKVSGNAQYIYKERIFHHGTLLFDTNLSILGQALRVNKLKLESKGIKSARQRVSNIRPLLNEDMSPEEFSSKLINFFEGKGYVLFDITNYKVNEIKALLNVRKSSGWIFGKNPEFVVNNEKRFFGGTISVHINIKENIITEILFRGDFLSSIEIDDLYKLFINQDFNDRNIKRIINDIDNFDNYFEKIKKDELCELILGQ